jgi:hypothetical protein
VALADADAILVDDGNAGTTQRKSTLTRVWTWIVSKLTAVTDVTTIGGGWVLDEDTMVSNSATKLATQQSIKAYIDANPAAWDGDITDMDITGAADIAEALAGTDEFVVYNLSGTANKKSAVSRVSTYIKTELQAVTDVNDIGDIGTGWVLDEDTLVSDSATKLATQQSIKAYADNKINYDTLWVPAASMAPSETNGAAVETYEYTSNNMTHDALLFAGAGQDEHAEFDMVFPEQWDEGTIKYKVYWDAAAGASAADDVRFYMAAAARSNDDALDAGVGALQNADDAVIAVGDLHITPASSALTVGGTPAVGDMIHFRISRDYDYGGTPMTEDARVFGVLVQYQRNGTSAAW